MFKKQYILNTFAVKLFQSLKKPMSFLLFNSKNYCSKNTMHKASPSEVILKDSEISIETPYGHIAGKLWNKGGTRTPILACHGWLDNAGTWDHLVPYLDTNFPILAIDFPGHGLSTPKPLGFSGHIIDNLLSIERVIKYFNWKKIIFLGHSMGGAVGMLYSGTFPAKVEKLIMMDLFKPIHVDAEDQPENTALSIQELLNVEEKQLTEPPRYSYSEILEKTVAAYKPSLSEESAKTLLKRGSQMHDNDTYSYTHSQFLKTKNIMSMTVDQQKSFAAKVKCDLLAIKFDKAPHYTKKEILKDFLNIYEKNSANFVFEVVSGTHHAHLNNPEDVAPLINEFLNDIPQDNERKLKSEKFVELTCY